MSVTPQTPATLADWLSYIEALHPKNIAMGLDRVQAMATRLDLNPIFPIITVGGTNGKGSTCAMLSQIYAEAGFSVGTYSSPHILRYNERVKINGQEASDEALCLAFAAVEAARGDIALTYFEMGTLAAMWHFMQHNIDVAILEIGLGGRLDAVNVFEPSCAIVTGIDLDHMEYLGDTREKIGLEKAGIFRQHKPAICGDAQPPQSLCDYAQQVGAHLQLIGHEFKVTATQTGWRYESQWGQMELSNPNLSGDFQRNNAACAVHAVLQMASKLPVTQANIDAALRQVSLAGRFQQIASAPQVIVDVAHNPQAAESLAHNLASKPIQGRTLAVFAMLADKDIARVIAILSPHISSWFVASIHAPRGESANNLQQHLSACTAYDQVEEAMQAAYEAAAKNDRIIAFGSFYTVAGAIAYVQTHRA